MGNQNEPQSIIQLANSEMAIFEKELSSTDVEKRLVIPTECLSYIEGSESSNSVEIQVEDVTGYVHRFCCTTRKYGYKKPVFIGGWMSYVRQKNLRAGDKIVFGYGDGAMYKIQAQRRITLMGHDMWANV